MRHVDALALDRAECDRLVPSLVLAGRLLTDAGHDLEAADLRQLGTACAAVADAFTPAPQKVTLTEWARRHGIAERTARRWAAEQPSLGAVRSTNNWLVSPDAEPPRPRLGAHGPRPA
jgi:hypothetical protein